MPLTKQELSRNKALRTLRAVRLGLGVVRNERILNQLVLRIENAIDKDFGEYENEVKEAYTITYNAVQERKMLIK
jgi:hypothetical protein